MRKKAFNLVNIFFFPEGKILAVYQYVNMCVYTGVCVCTRMCVCVCVCACVQTLSELSRCLENKAYCIFNLEESSSKWMPVRAGDWEPLLIVTMTGDCCWHWMGGGKESGMSCIVWNTLIWSRIMPSQIYLPNWGRWGGDFGDRQSGFEFWFYPL